jgi:hypothetical protein
MILQEACQELQQNVHWYPLVSISSLLVIGQILDASCFQAGYFASCWEALDT